MLVGLLTVLMTGVGQVVMAVMGIIWIGEGPDAVVQAMKRGNDLFYAGPGEFVAVGGVALLLPALALASRIVKDRPFSSYSSSRGGWNWSGFLKCFIVAAIVFGGVITGLGLLFPDSLADGVNKFTAIGLLVCLVVVPFQAAAEEYLYRGGCIRKKRVSGQNAQKLSFSKEI